MQKSILIALFLIMLVLGTAESISGPDYMALAQAQRAEGNISNQLDGIYYMADIKNSTSDLMPKITPGEYDSNSYVIPVGPYQVSFLVRYASNVFGVGYITYNQTAGSGKTYRENEYGKYHLHMEDSSDKMGSFNFYITHYIGPSEYLPEDPYPYGYDENDVWDWDSMDCSSRNITIDKHPGKELSCEDGHRQLWYYTYQLNSSTFVLIDFFNMDWDKDISLAIDTLHITMLK